MTKEEAINKLAHIIFDAAKGGSIPFNIDGEHCAMSVARAKINEFLSPSSDATELPMPNLDDAAKVNLEKEIDKIWNPRFNFGWDEKSLLSINHEGFTTIAKHFYELGLKTKGE